MNPEILKISGALALPQIGGLVHDYLTMSDFEDWHQHLNVSPFKPPTCIALPMWTSLHLGMGYASYLVWKDGGGLNGAARVPMALYGAHLALNWGWTTMSVKLRSLKWIFVESLVHAGAVAATGLAFFKVNKIAGYLFIPYFAWCSFNSLLNFEVYRRNPGEARTIEEEAG
ncbi:hypothetical protein quinque_008408 [Culex quinquefasciatus]